MCNVSARRDLSAMNINICSFLKFNLLADVSLILCSHFRFVVVLFLNEQLVPTMPLRFGFNFIFHAFRF